MIMVLEKVLITAKWSWQNNIEMCWYHFYFEYKITVEKPLWLRKTLLRTWNIVMAIKHRYQTIMDGKFSNMILNCSQHPQLRLQFYLSDSLCNYIDVVWFKITFATCIRNRITHFCYIRSIFSPKIETLELLISNFIWCNETC